MIIHDLAALGPDLIGRAILTAAAYSGLGAALGVGCVCLLTTVLTGAWPRSRRRTR